MKNQILHSGKLNRIQIFCLLNFRFVIFISLFAISGMQFSAAQTILGGVNLGNLPAYHMVFTHGEDGANWQGASKGFVGNVAINGKDADERTAGTVPFAGTIYTNDNTLGAWQNIVNDNPGQAYASLSQGSRINDLEDDLEDAFLQINALTVTPGYNGIDPSTLNGLNTQNNIQQTIVINVTSGFDISDKIYITGDSSDIFILRWDEDAIFNNGYDGKVKFDNGGGIVPLGGLKPTNFIHVAGDIKSSGGGNNPLAPFPQGPRNSDGTGTLINGGNDFNGGGFFTGYWLTTGKPTIDDGGKQDYGATSTLSNGIFVGGWYSKTSSFSMTSGTSGVYVSPPSFCNLGNLVWEDKNFNGIQDIGEKGVKNTIIRLYADVNNDNQPDGQALQTFITGDNGLYNFGGLIAGNYIVGVTPELNKFIGGPTTATSNLPNNNNNTDNNGVNQVGNEIFSNTISLTLGNEPTDDGDGNNGNLSVDFGLVKPSSVGDRIWLDNDKDGKFNHGEVGYAFVSLDLLSMSGQILRTTTTDISGKYKISNLLPGTYYMKITPPLTYTLTTKGDGTDTTDSDFDQISYYTNTFNLGYDAEKKDVDGGLIAPVLLPVTLTQFNGKLNGNTAVLHWETEQEINHAYYSVERSWDGSVFAATGSNITGNGTVTQRKAYDFQDLLPQSGISKVYYRIKIVSLSGEVTYSNIIILRPGTVKVNKLYPNPVATEVTLEMESKENVQAAVIITDLQGKQVFYTKRQLFAGGNLFTIRGLGALPTGTYQLQIIGNTETITERLIKK